MGRFTTSRVFAFSVLLVLLASRPVRAQKEEEWTWKDRDGKTHTRAELDLILRKHQQWLGSTGGKSFFRAYIRAMHGVNPYAYSRSENLSDANQGAAQADLSGALLVDANLSGAELALANLSRVELTGANLSGADLLFANLADADLSEADTTNAILNANLSGAVFEPKSLPQLGTIAAAKNLEFMTYIGSPDALVQLRKQFEDGGFREQERKITYALKRREAELSWIACESEDRTGGVLSSDSSLAGCGSFVLNRVFFDWTCQYGMSPGRPLSLGVLLWLLCSVLYLVCIHAPGKTGLYRVYAPSLQENSSVSRRVEEILPAEMKALGARRFLEFFRREWAVFRASMFFSLMSAFNIGFRDINFGRWLRLLTRQEFDIKAVGWARVVAGWQSLISVYFIALWVLTYFGRPFG